MLIEVTVDNDQVTKKKITFKPFNLAFLATPGHRTSIDHAQMLSTVVSLTAQEVTQKLRLAIQTFVHVSEYARVLFNLAKPKLRNYLLC